ncbi:MAG: hypothetical protein ACLUFW_11045 [Alistipes sp.]
MLRIVAITLIQGMLPAIFGLVFLWIKSDVTLIAPWPTLMLFIFFANLLIVAAGWKYLGVTRSDRQGASHTYVPCRFRAVIDL